ncbi:hypothetical protein HYPSUDRAFT_524173 [Hypholoma sublateritium FD-334 SS-4]|uniref:Uncharacterized protein n=1 Tax=Hypholoma sublateritium (strain FD-334 SS-4) TaxID=945553 RepID=A0A0D2LN38_HYPSF|nr:hypothetical protein HYPSUDRAFT_524173 [Hypholoma sublateritium FD-334 SS-4]
MCRLRIVRLPQRPSPSPASPLGSRPPLRRRPLPDAYDIQIHNRHVALALPFAGFVCNDRPAKILRHRLTASLARPYAKAKMRRARSFIIQIPAAVGTNGSGIMALFSGIFYAVDVP